MNEIDLQADFDDLLSAPRPLESLDSLIWKTLASAADQAGHPWKEAAVATLQTPTQASQTPCPEIRTIILRRVDEDARTIDFHTDLRSPKVDQIRHAGDPSPISWLFYDSSSKIQLRLSGTATVVSGAAAQAAWESVREPARDNYRSAAAPGTFHAGDDPPSDDQRLVQWSEDSDAGRRWFCIVRTTITTADWLYLRRGGHVRASVNYSTTGRSTGRWVMP
ncbi:PNPOx family protein [Crateriforma conspicua]|uniref:pyridoxamine 5'-phosphate oxidase family protein n=1 Tax=Crateriforma conspicua TaxID=2527996 RepID=UPI00118AC2AC|nr:pyridoxamine 5'-phosphate oxidase family protein [Crateriforma conspicua]QDV63595.1 Pyridoxamine 5'-phosphate oxidase [Crateriforma conspicua]